jgi:hypothetical protein
LPDGGASWERADRLFNRVAAWSRPMIGGSRHDPILEQNLLIPAQWRA